MADLGQIGSANVELRANGKRLKRDLDRARVGVGRSADKSGRMFGQRFGASAKRFIGPAIAGLLSAAAVRGFARGAQKAIDKLDEIAKTADGIGLTTDALQELRVAADLSGVSAGALNSSLRRFARTASDAKNGLSTAVRAFESVGVSVTDTDGRLKDIDVLVDDVADGFVGMTNATQRAATAQELFGRAGTTMVNLLVQGSTGIQKMRRQARELGIVLEEDLIRRSVKAKDELTLLNRVIDAQLTVALADLAPLLISIAGFLADVATRAGQAYKGMRLLLGLPVVELEVRVVTPQLEDARRQLQELDEEFKTFETKGISPLALSLGFKAKPLSTDELNTKLQEFAERRASIVVEIESLEARLATALLVPDFGDLDLGGGGAGDGGATSDVDERTAAMVRLREEVESQIDAEIRNRQEIGATIATLGEEQGVRERLISQLELNRLARELDTAALSATNDEQRQEIEQAKELLPLLRAITDARQMDQVTLRNQEDALAKTEQGERELASAIASTSDELVRAAFEGRNFIQILANLALRLVEIQALQFAEGGAGGKGGKGGILSALLSAGLAGLGAVFGAPTGTANSSPGAGGASLGRLIGGGREHGGPVSAGQFSLVGEAGPEIAFFGSPARIFSNDDLQELVSGGASNQGARPVKVTMNITTPDVGSFRRSQSQVAAELGRMIRQGQARQT